MFPKVLVKELKELPFPPPEIFEETILLEAEDLLHKLRSGANPEIADNFVEAIFLSIPVDFVSNMCANSSKSQTMLGTKRSQSRKTKHIGQQSFDFFPLTSETELIQTSPKIGNQWGVSTIDQILAWLESQKGWFPKSVILNGCGADPDACDSAINELIKDDYIESRSDGNETRYRAKE